MTALGDLMEFYDKPGIEHSYMQQVIFTSAMMNHTPKRDRPPPYARQLMCACQKFHDAMWYRREQEQETTSTLRLHQPVVERQRRHDCLVALGALLELGHV